MAVASRTEVEVLMKMRAEGQQALDLFSGGLGKVSKEGAAAAKETDKVDDGNKKVGASATAAGVALGIMAERALSAAVGGFRSAIDSANRLDAALAGLGSVAAGMNQPIDLAKQAAIELSRDGLMSVAESATALKNLLAVGYGLEEATQLLNAHKDAAAFNRQGMLGFGESIVRVTEGLKFNNSQLTDSTGLGENLSQTMKKAGLAQDAFGNAVNNAEARQAVLNATLKSAATFNGDAAKFAASNAGAQVQLAAASERASAAIGKQLQPAVGAFAAVAGPLLGIVEKYPGIFLAAGTAIGGVVAPILAVKAAAMLGIPSLASMGSGAVALGTALRGANLSTVATNMGALSGATGLAGKALGAAGIAAAAVGTAIVGWQIGKAIGEWTGLTNAISNATAKMMGWNVTSVPAEEQQRAINVAIGLGAKAGTDYAGAMQFMTERAAALRAEQAPALEQARQRAEADRRANEITANRTALLESVAAADRKVRDELAATGLTTSELTGQLRRNETAFEAWAEKAGLSAETIAFLKEQIKKQDEAQKKANESTEEAAQVAEQQRAALAALGIVTMPAVNKELAELAALEKRAVAEGVPAVRIAQVLTLEYQKLAVAASGSGVGVAAINTELARLRGMLPAFPQLDKTLIKDPSTFTDALPKGIRTVTAETLRLQTQTYLTGRSFEYFGQTTRTELLRTAEEARIRYNDMIASGQALPAALAEARDQMLEAEEAAGIRVKSIWRDEVWPDVKAAGVEIRDAFASNLAGMLLGTQSFADGWSAIWGTIKQSAVDILSDLLNWFIGSFLKGMLGSIMGQQGAFSAAFGSLFSGASAGMSGVGAGAGGAGAGAGGTVGIGAGLATAGLGVAAVGAGVALGTMAYQWGSAFFGEHYISPEAQAENDRAEQIRMAEYTGAAARAGMSPEEFIASGGVPGFAEGGLVDPRPGGMLARIGEGGEPELVGPKRFFRDVLEGLMNDAGGSGGEGAGGNLSLTFNVTTLSGGGELRDVVETEIIPMILDAVRWNRRQARTDLRSVVGIQSEG